MTYDHIILHCMTNKIKWLFLLIMSFYELMFRFFFFFLTIMRKIVLELVLKCLHILLQY